MDLNKARELLGVSEDATMEEVDDRFFILIKREQNLVDNSNKQDKIDELNQAYQLLKSDILKEDENNSNETFKDKLDHFFTYYKFHVIVGIISIIIVGAIISTIIDNQKEKAYLASLPPAAVEVLIYGEYFNADYLPLAEEDLEQYKENLKTVFPDWERIQLDLLYAPQQPETQHEVGLTMKNAAELSTLRPDIFILDEHQFNVYRVHDSYLALEDVLPDELLSQIDEENLFYAQTEDDTEEHLYGIRITDSSMFDGANIQGEKIVAIVENTDDYDNAVEFVTTAVEEINE